MYSFHILYCFASVFINAHIYPFLFPIAIISLLSICLSCMLLPSFFLFPYLNSCMIIYAFEYMSEKIVYFLQSLQVITLITMFTFLLLKLRNKSQNNLFSQKTLVSEHNIIVVILLKYFRFFVAGMKNPGIQGLYQWLNIIQT